MWRGGGLPQHPLRRLGCQYGVVSPPIYTKGQGARKKFYFFVTRIFLTFEGWREGIDLPLYTYDDYTNIAYCICHFLFLSFVYRI